MSELIPNTLLEFDSCVSSGQVFRFQQSAGLWRGVDGAHIIEAKRAGAKWQVGSRPDEGAYKHFFRLDENLKTIQKKLLAIEPRLAPLIAEHPGLRIVRCASAEETLFTFMCTPNNHLVRITRMVNALAQYGHEIEACCYEFPNAERIAAIDENELRQKGFGWRAKTITMCARAIAEREPNWAESLKDATYEEARTELCKLHGIGRKLADCICLFGLHFTEAVPLDTHLWKAGCALYHPEWLGTSITELKYKTLSDEFRDRFGKLAGWAQQYLFYDRLLTYRKHVGRA